MSPCEPVVDVARRALGDRLQLVGRYLSRASHGAPSDTENVHQLRVSTRRAVAAMEIFDALLPERRKRRMTKQLKRVRKAAGAARDLDVMLARFRPLAEEEASSSSPAEESPSCLLHALKVHRQRAQDPIDKSFEKLGRKEFRRSVKALVNRVRLRTKDDRLEEPTFADAAQSALEPLVRGFVEAGEADFHDYTLLHAFRIQGKQLRYAMEVFAGAFEPSFREELYPRVAALQERLGEINDHATAREIFTLWLAENDIDDLLRGTLEKFVMDENTAVEAKRQEFLDWWTIPRRDDLRHRFAEALAMDQAELKPNRSMVLLRAE